jgi:DNA-binding response OmpR family regulator
MYLIGKNLKKSSLPNSLKEVNTVSENIRVSPQTNVLSPLVLIVEDDDDTRIMLRYLLEIWNYKVIEAGSGEEAIQVAKIEQPDVILMDYKLPLIDGLATTKQIREQKSLAETVIIFVSAESASSIRDCALAAGGDDFLLKPIDFGALEISLEKHLNSKNKGRASFASRVI